MTRRTLISAQLLLILLVLMGPALSIGAEIPWGPQNVVEDPFTDPLRLTSADLDGDGDLDLLATSATDDDVAWWENTAGDGSAWIRHDLELDFNFAFGIAAGDLDGDGDDDIVASGFFENSVSWWQNDLSSGLACGADFCETPIDVTALAASAVDIIDLDGDGDLDVLAAHRQPDDVVWYENTTGDGSIWTEHSIDTDLEAAQGVAFGDLDGDGDLDVLAGGGEAGSFAWFENDLEGSTICGSPWCKHPLSSVTTVAVGIGDLDGDGDLDLAQSSPAGMSWWANTAGDASAWTETAISTDGGTGVLQIVDLDFDGDLDLLPGTEGPTWLENTAGNATAWIERDVDSVSGTYTLHAADLDGDGDLDLAGVSIQTDDLAWWRNETVHRSAAFATGLDVGGFLSSVKGVAVADLDGDGDVDIVGASLTGDLLRWSENDGTPLDGGFVDHTLASDIDGPVDVQAVDVDGDGDLDVVAALLIDDSVTWFENDGTPGDGTWLQRTIATGFDRAIFLEVTDLDLDGDPDVVASARDGNEVAWFENDGTPADGAWVKHSVVTSFEWPQEVEAGDIDQDGDIDIIATSRFDGLVLWFESDGTPADGGWTQHTIRADTDWARDVDLCDVDGDGDLDLAFTDTGAGTVSWFEHDGTPAGDPWPEHEIDLSFAKADSVVCADADGDGDLDIAATSGDTNRRVTVWQNDGSPADGGWQRLDVTSAFSVASGIAFADIDQDGRQDLIAGSFIVNRVRWWPNVGGQFALPTLDVAPATPNEGAIVPVLRIDGAHRGRTGDDDAELATLELLFEEAPDVPLAPADFSALIDVPRFYRDDGDGVFEPGADDLELGLAAPFPFFEGRLTATLIDGDPDTAFAVDVPASWFVALELEPDAGTATLDSFRVSHVTEASSTGHIAGTDMPLTLEFAANVASTTMMINGAPSLASPIGAQTVQTGVSIGLDVSAGFTDPEGGALSFTANGLPSSLSMSATGVLTGTTTIAEIAGSPYGVTVAATDSGGLSAVDNFDLSVTLFGGTIVVDGACTLADAIRSANTNIDTGSCTGAGGVETIVLDADVSLSAAETVDSALLGGAHAGLPDVTSEITLRAGSASTVARDSALDCVADGANHFRLLNLRPNAALTLDGVTLTGGCANLGGAIYAEFGSAFTALGATFADNVAQGDTSSEGLGGALFLEPAMLTESVIRDSLFQGNEARGGDNIAGDGGSAAGGAVFDTGAIGTIERSTFTNNVAIGGNGTTNAGSANGGAMLSTAATHFIDVNFTGNRVEGGHASAGDGGAAGGGGLFSDGEPDIFERCSFIDNRAIGGAGSNAGGPAVGGGLAFFGGATFSDTSFTDNLAEGGAGNMGNGGDAEGGAIFHTGTNDGPATLSHLIVGGNQAIGGASTLATGGQAEGGGMVLDESTVTLARVSSNVARGGDGVSSGVARGGGIQLVGGAMIADATIASNLAHAGTSTTNNAAFAVSGGLSGGLAPNQAVDLFEVTVSDNEARGGDSSAGGAGGIAVGGGASYRGRASHVTLARNRSVGGVGAGGNGNASSGGVDTGLSPNQFDNTILAGNTTIDGGGSPVASDCGGLAGATSLGFNLVQEPGSCTFAATGDQTGVDPLLEPLGDYGCVTPFPNGTCVLVHAIDETSPAVDQGSCGVSGETADARGFGRPFDFATVSNADDACDIGAYEVQDQNNNGIDDFFDRIFVDNFESGDTSAWSLTVP